MSPILDKIKAANVFKKLTPARIKRAAFAIGLVCVGIVGTLLLTGSPPQATGAQEMASPPKPKRNGRDRNYNGPACFERKARPGEPASYCGDLRSLAAVNIREGQLDIVVKGLTYPWAFEFLSDTDVLVTEFSGTLSRIDTVSQKKTVISGLPEIESGKGQTGLMDVALHPDFGRNNLIYLSYAIKNTSEQFALAISRATLVEDTLTAIQKLIVADPFAPSRSNFGGALMFGDDGYLYIGTGDRSKRNWAQHPDKLTGKILRLGEDGTIPPGNPFVDTKGYHPAIFALGVRNPQGLVQDPLTNTIFEAEHGPMGGDEVNIIEKGANYGWPVVSYGMNYTYNKIGEGQRKEGINEPLFYYLPSLAISPIEIYRGQMFPEWEGDLLVGALKAQLVSKLDNVGSTVLSDTRILNEIKGRIRDIKVARDGSIWLLSQRGELFRLSRTQAETASAAVPPGGRTGQAVYDLVCSTCHSQNLPNMPRLGIAEDWTDRLPKGKEALYQSTIAGINGMPARGLCEDCTDEELKRSVDYMLSTLSPATP